MVVIELNANSALVFDFSLALMDNIFVWKSKIYVFWLGSYVVGQIFPPQIQCIIWVVKMRVSG